MARAARSTPAEDAPRTEAEVAADALWLLVTAKILPAPMVVRALQTLGLTRRFYVGASERALAGCEMRPSHAAVARVPRTEPNPETAVDPDWRPSEKALRQPKVARKNPRPGQRICSGPCGELLPVSAFDYKDGSKQYVKPWCRDCTALYQRGRYLTIEKAEAVNAAVVHMRLMEGDLVLGQECCVCRQGVAAGDEVLIGGILTHAFHIPLELHGRSDEWDLDALERFLEQEPARG